MCAQVSAIEEITVRSSSSQHENKPILLLAVMLWQRYIFVKKIDNILQLLKIMAM